MEKFKTVEKAMKTKAFSKEGLSAATKLDPKERAKMEACDFLSNMVDELERQIETLEAEGEGLQVTMKKGKNQSAKADRMAEIERLTERHKWHQGKMELIKRSLENGGVETEQVNELEEDIKYYVTSGMEDDFMEDEEMYDNLNLEEEEGQYGMNNDNDKVSSQDNQSIQDEAPEPETRSNSIPGSKPKSTAEAPSAAARRPSTQMKSPLPALATLHTPLSNISNGTANMKPASVPVRATGEPLKYASAAAAAAASDKSNLGIAPLPPPPEALSTPNTSVSHPPLPYHAGGRPNVATVSPSAVYSQPATATKSTVAATATLAESSAQTQTKSPALSQSSAAPSGSSLSQHSTIERTDSARPGISPGSSGKAAAVIEASEGSKGLLFSLPMLYRANVFEQPPHKSMGRQMALILLPLKTLMSRYIIFPLDYRIYFNHSKLLKNAFQMLLRSHHKECWQHHHSPVPLT
jgi:CCR4-NOT transcription complex subunit 3